MSDGQVPILPPYPVGFPNPEHSLDEPDGLLAAGGDLTPEWLLEAYAGGIFPWFDRDDGPPLWWSPSERGVITPGAIKVSRSLQKRLRNPNFTITLDRAFESVIQACAQTRASTGTWITPAMQMAYIELHVAGFGHSVEVWQDDELVGGLYGISLGQMFFGESMFAKASDASKVAFYHLHQQLKSWEFSLIDCQMMNPHLESLGVRPMPRSEFLRQLAVNNLALTRLGPWTLDHELALR